jgi:DNA-binding MarR family transcriptional regulator
MDERAVPLARVFAVELGETVGAANTASASKLQRRQWRDARRFQARAQKALAREGVSFVEWLVLETLHEAITELDDAVSQVEVARRTGLSQRVVSYWMLQMTEYGAVDRAPTPDGRAWRVLLTKGGQLTRDRCNQRLEAAGLTG